ncbi:ABC transporter ATP-binding protein [Alteromonas sp. KUL42]|uniref:ABC transporter ATP-binding protein n=1 Tax=Alteromonas sp. KUL42 TaxID=2480797 RepID=UPI00079A93AC|nr:ABC transporter ATP-binding protein [Alteromonas sp. KUL42]KXJ58188.1 MAG: polysaccharide/polyol phosphate ABC transporter ATP-binding protein [Alteromonas sp. Nap_26]TAP37500.1 ABC transporter ATP-binding protein [Alteromonas sp. KUL42]GEA05914.1 ABC transporter ATP-binding protein [Alteromonas sp. KUL42]
MIRLEGLTKSYPSKIGRQYIFRDLNFEFPTENNVAILGKNGAGKSTLFRMLAKSEYPDKGRVVTNKSMSWPVALQTGVHPLMTGRENTRFIGRINNVHSLKGYEERVQEFAELGQKFDLPVQSYSSGMRAKLVFACCMNIDFDIYLIDEATSVGDPLFRKKARQSLKEKSEQAGVIMVSHELDQIREFCTSAVIIGDGTLTYYNDLEEGIEVYTQDADNKKSLK